MPGEMELGEYGLGSNEVAELASSLLKFVLKWS